ADGAGGAGNGGGEDGYGSGGDESGGGGWDLGVAAAFDDSVVWEGSNYDGIAAAGAAGASWNGVTATPNTNLRDGGGNGGGARGVGGIFSHEGDSLLSVTDAGRSSWDGRDPAAPFLWEEGGGAGFGSGRLGGFDGCRLLAGASIDSLDTLSLAASVSSLQGGSGGGGGGCDRRHPFGAGLLPGLGLHDDGTASLPSLLRPTDDVGLGGRKRSKKDEATVVPRSGGMSLQELHGRLKCGADGADAGGGRRNCAAAGAAAATAMRLPGIIKTKGTRPRMGGGGGSSREAMRPGDKGSDGSGAGADWAPVCGDSVVILPIKTFSKVAASLA
ncbi:unnamed protein product, partial [Phaeothamnion confervicola]